MYACMHVRGRQLRQNAQCVAGRLRTEGADDICGAHGQLVQQPATREVPQRCQRPRRVGQRLRLWRRSARARQGTRPQPVQLEACLHCALSNNKRRQEHSSKQRLLTVRAALESRGFAISADSERSDRSQRTSKCGSSRWICPSSSRNCGLLTISAAAPDVCMECSFARRCTAVATLTLCHTGTPPLRGLRIDSLLGCAEALAGLGKKERAKPRRGVKNTLSQQAAIRFWRPCILLLCSHAEVFARACTAGPTVQSAYVATIREFNERRPSLWKTNQTLVSTPGFWRDGAPRQSRMRCPRQCPGPAGSAWRWPCAW